MAFKLTLLGIEIGNSESKSVSEDASEESSNTYKMKKKKLTTQQKKFIVAQKACHHLTKSPTQFGKCMSRRLKR